MTTLPSFNLYQIERRRRIVEQAIAPCLGKAINVDDVARVVHQSMPATVSYDSIFESVRYLAGQHLAQNDATRLAWRLAGNMATLKAGQPVTPWAVQHKDEWVPLTILRVDRQRDRFNRLGYNAVCRVLAGSPSPMKITTFWNDKATYMIANSLGFSNSWGKYPFKGGRNLVGLRLVGFIEQERSHERPSFFQVDCPPSMVTWNRTHVLKLRCRVDNAHKCPMSYRHACQQCAVGYERCDAGTHFRSYQLGGCAGCGKENVMFDPEDTTTVCITCSLKERTKLKETQ